MLQCLSSVKIIPKNYTFNKAKWKTLQRTTILRALFFRLERRAWWNWQKTSTGKITEYCIVQQCFLNEVPLYLLALFYHGYRLVSQRALVKWDINVLKADFRYTYNYNLLLSNSCSVHCTSTYVHAYTFECLFKIWFLINTFIVSSGNFALSLTFPANPILLETID